MFRYRLGRQEITVYLQLGAGVMAEGRPGAADDSGQRCIVAPTAGAGVAGRIFFLDEHLLQLVELGRAEVAVALQEADKRVHG